MHIKTNACPPPPAQLLDFFLQLLPLEALLRLPALKIGGFYKRLFTPPATLWLLLFQRLNPDHTLDAAVGHARAGGADAMNPGLSARLRSDSSPSYSDGRQRLPVRFAREALQSLGSKISGLCPDALWKGLRPVLLDGSTVRMRSQGDIPRKFPPHGNQRGPGYWCLMRVVVPFCAASGAALDCAMGSIGMSEQALGARIILRAAAGCLFVGDRNFGIFLVAQAARAKGQHVLLRLTDLRASKIFGGTLRLGDHAVAWKPGRDCRLRRGLGVDPIVGRLLVMQIQRPGFRTQRLCLFTTLVSCTGYPARELVELYGLRWRVEVDLRHVKAGMDSAQLEVRSADMARKEWLASLMAYNLVRAASLCAALHAGVPALRLSFSGCRRRLEDWLREFGADRERACAKWEGLLVRMGTCRLPRRRNPRPSEPRAKRHLRESFPPLVGSRAAARRKLQKLNGKT